MELSPVRFIAYSMMVLLIWYFLNVSPAAHMDADYFVFDGVDYGSLRQA